MVLLVSSLEFSEHYVEVELGNRNICFELILRIEILLKKSRQKRPLLVIKIPQAEATRKVSAYIRQDMLANRVLCNLEVPASTQWYRYTRWFRVASRNMRKLDFGISRLGMMCSMVMLLLFVHRFNGNFVLLS